MRGNAEHQITSLGIEIPVDYDLDVGQRYSYSVSIFVISESVQRVKVM